MKEEKSYYYPSQLLVGYNVNIYLIFIVSCWGLFIIFLFSRSSFLLVIWKSSLAHEYGWMALNIWVFGRFKALLALNPRLVYLNIIRIRKIENGFWFAWVKIWLKILTLNWELDIRDELQNASCWDLCWAEPYILAVV